MTILPCYFLVATWSFLYIQIKCYLSLFQYFFLAAATAPSTLLTLMNCGTPSNDIYSLGCIAKGFSPSSHTFQWTDASGKALTDFVQYPAVQSGETYTGVSQLRVAKNVWENSKSFSCSVDHAGDVKTAVINIPSKMWTLYCISLWSSKDCIWMFVM